jgi:hypothetical protein
MVLKCRITLYDDVPTRRKAELADAELTKEKSNWLNYGKKYYL